MARRDRRRATSSALAVSALVHLVLFLVLAYQATPMFRAPPETAPDFDLQLVHEPAALPPSNEPLYSARRPRAPHPTRSEVHPPSRPALRVLQTPLRPSLPRTPSAPSTSLSRVTANTPAPGAGAGVEGAGAGAKGSAGRWAVQGEDDENGVRKFLRATVGCSHQDYLHLTEQERANCDRRIGEDARAFNIPPDKLAGFIAAAEAQERTRAGRTGPLEELVTPCKGPGANLDRSCLNLRGRPPDE